MKRCLFCGNPIEESPHSGQWHQQCSKKFFHADILPRISLSEHTLESMASKAIGEGITLPGVKKKLSLTLLTEKGKQPRLTIADKPTGFILKPQAKEYAQLPEAEDLVMRMAGAAAIATVPHGLLYLEDGSLVYITKRIHREGKRRISMEDFCQLSGRLTEDKYKGSYEMCSKLLQKWSSRPLLDVTNFFYLLLFSFVTGNSDMHLKNFSLIADSLGTYVLAPAYDLLPVNLLLEEDTDEMALTLCEKKVKLSYATFLQLGKHLGIAELVVHNLIKKLHGLQPIFRDIIETSFVSEGMKTAMKQLVSERLQRLIPQ